MPQRLPIRDVNPTTPILILVTRRPAAWQLVPLRVSSCRLLQRSARVEEYGIMLVKTSERLVQLLLGGSCLAEG